MRNLLRLIGALRRVARLTPLMERAVVAMESQAASMAAQVRMSELSLRHMGLTLGEGETLPPDSDGIFVAYVNDAERVEVEQKREAFFERTGRYPREGE